MRKYLFTILVTLFLGSCVSLDNEKIALNSLGSIKGDSLEKALVDPTKGIHYVFVDTTDKELLIRFESEKVGKAYISTLIERLSEEGLLFEEVKEVDTTIAVLDTTLVNSIPEDESVENEMPEVIIPETHEVEEISFIEEYDSTIINHEIVDSVSVDSL